MSKKALRKDFYMEIVKSLGRFLSIFFIVALGVAFFAGIRSAEPDMRHSGDFYFDVNHLMDVKVLGTMGLTQDDVQAIQKVEGIQKVEAGYSTDVLFRDTDDSQTVLHVTSLLPSLNKITVSEGRLPQTVGECLIDEDFIKHTDYQLGDTIQLSSGTEEKLTDTLKTEQLKIVGIGNSPCYISFGRGNSEIGTGTVNGFVTVVPENFSQDVYSEIYASVKGAKDTISFTKAYKDKVKYALDNVEDISKTRCNIRQESIKEEANAELDKAKQELADGKAEANTKLAEAKATLDDGMTQLLNAKEDITSGEQSIASAKRQLASKQKELKSASATYQSGVAQLNKGKEELAAQTATYEEKKVQAEPQIQAGETQIAAARTQLDEQWKQYEAFPDKTIPEAQGMLAGLEQAEQSLQVQIQTLEEMKAQLAQGGEAIGQAEAQIAANESRLADAKAQIESGKSQINAGWRELNKQDKKLQDGRQTLVSKETELAEGQATYNEEKIKAEKEIADGEAKIADAQQKIDEIELPKWYVQDRTALPEYNGYGENADRMRAIGRVFPVLFFLVAALISLTTMTRMVEEQRVQIGTLKALGYGKYAIAGKYLNYAFLATLGGSIFGVLVGEKVLPYIIIYAYGIMYLHMPHIIIPYNVKYGVIATVAALACTIAATLMACYKELATTPSVLMRPPAPKQGKRVFMERITFIWKHLSFSWKSTIRNLIRYKKRFFMTVFGIGGCMALMLVGFGLKDSVFDIADIQYAEIQLYDGATYLKDNITDVQREALSSYISKEGKIQNYMRGYMKNITIGNEGVEKDVYVMVPEKAEEIKEYVVLQDRITNEFYELQDEGAIITEKMAKMLSVKKGDTIYIKDSKTEKKSVKIVEICENYMGHYLYLTPKLYQEIYGKAPIYNTILFKMHQNDKQQLLEVGQKMLSYKGVLNVNYTNSIRKQLDDMLKSLNLVIIVLIVSAGMLAFVVLYDLNNININERQRELATLKVLGFYDGEVGAYVYRENILLTMIGALVGCGMGKVLHRFIVVTVEVDGAMFGRNINLPSYIYSALFTIGFALFVNWVMYFKLKKIDMVESLKSVE
ncbi:MAG: FtsX-like permease family protein [Lachnospiraceae bacterium]